MSKEFICKGCGEKFNKDMQSNNVGYCYICNEFYMKKYVSDLEAKLAESQNTVCKHIAELTKIATEKDKQIEELKQQLAEKDNELTILKLDYEFVSKEYNKLVDIGVSKFKQHNQDKISFAVEQLEKVRECFIDGYALCKNFSDLYWNFTEQIDNQIAQLTHQHEDKGE